MKEKAKDLIYLDSNRYISIQSLRVLYLAIIIIPFTMVVWGAVAIHTVGVNFKSLFPIISIAIWSLLYWTFVLIIQNRKKTFELRFLVNGVSGLLISSLFWILYASLSIIADEPIIGFDFLLWLLIFYLLFSAIYIGLVVLGVHKGIFKKIKEKSKKPKALAVSAFFASILPSMGALGMWASRVIRNNASVSTQNIITTVALVLVIYLPALAHINFVQYFYCKKYKILCDENGNTTSPNLERQIKPKVIKAKKKDHNQTNISGSNASNKKIPLAIKILFGILGVPIVLFIIVFLVFLIKGLIQAIA